MLHWRLCEFVITTDIEYATTLKREVIELLHSNITLDKMFFFAVGNIGFLEPCLLKIAKKR